MMSSGSTVLRFDFDIFSIRADFDRLAGRDQRGARAPRPAPSIFTSAGVTQSPFCLLIGLVHHHALGEHAGERLVDADVAGRLHGAGEEARIEQMQDRVLDAADVLVDRQPAVDRPCGRSARSSIHGSVKRAKYHDESTNVSIVSVSRRAGLPHCGHATCFQVG